MDFKEFVVVIAKKFKVAENTFMKCGVIKQVNRDGNTYMIIDEGTYYQALST